MSETSDSKRLHTKDYYDHFDTESYLATYAFFQMIPSFDILIKQIVRLFIKNRERIGHNRALEFGGGPTLMSSFILAQYVDSIRFVDYTPSNLQAVKDWIDESPDAHDWTSLFQAILKEFNEQCGEVEPTWNPQTCEDNLKRALKRGGTSVCTDVNSTEYCPILDGETKESYDIVLSALCLEDACLTFDAFKRTIKRLADLLKQNGLLVLSHGRNQSFYCINNCRFFALSINEDRLREALIEADFDDIDIVSIAKPPDVHADADGFLIAAASKGKSLK